LNWQCGIGAVAAREKVRVARALEQLPEIADAFAKGEISYSKVRAMTRVATTANESVLVHVARNGTAAHVEKLVRKFRWTQRRDAAKLAQRQHEFRKVSSFFGMDGEFILSACLPPEIGAVVGKALQVAVEAVRESKEVTAETPVQIPSDVWKADALRLMAETFLEHRGEVTGAGSSAERQTGCKSSCTSIKRSSPSSKPRWRRVRRIAASSRTARRSHSTRRGGSPAMPASSESSKARRASRSTSAARRAASLLRSRERCALVTAAAASPAAIARVSAKDIISSIGRTAAKRSSTT
jgi:hypothetical protein